jgi:hypothetical protein
MRKKIMHGCNGIEDIEKKIEIFYLNDDSKEHSLTVDDDMDGRPMFQRDLWLDFCVSICI